MKRQRLENVNGNGAEANGVKNAGEHNALETMEENGVENGEHPEAVMSNGIAVNGTSADNGASAENGEPVVNGIGAPTLDKVVPVLETPTKVIEDQEERKVNRKIPAAKREKLTQMAPNTSQAPEEEEEIEPPHRAQMDADFRLATRLQEEDDKVAREEAKKRYEQQALTILKRRNAIHPLLEKEVPTACEIDKAEKLFSRCITERQSVYVPAPMGLIGYNINYYIDGYMEVLNGNQFPLDPVINEPIRNTTHTPGYDDVVDTPVKDSSDNLHEGQNIEVGEYVTVSAESSDQQGGNQPGPSNRPVNLPRFARTFKEEQEEIRRAIRLSMQEYCKGNSSSMNDEYDPEENLWPGSPQRNSSPNDAYFPDPNVPSTSAAWDAQPSSSSKSSSRDCELSTSSAWYKNQPSTSGPPVYRPARLRSSEMDDEVFEETVYEIDEADISSTITTDADRVEPKAMWKDPEHMPEIKLIEREELKKMPEDYISEIRKEHTEGNNTFQPYPTEMETEYMQLIRSYFTCPCVVPKNVVGTRFEVYIRFPFLQRPLYVQNVIAALRAPDNNGDILPQMPEFIREMSVPQFFKYAAIIYMGLNFTNCPTTSVISAEQTRRARSACANSIQVIIDRRYLNGYHDVVSALEALDITEVDMIIMKMVRDQRVEENTAAILRKMLQPRVTRVIHSYSETDAKAVQHHEKQDDAHTPQLPEFGIWGPDPDPPQEEAEQADNKEEPIMANINFPARAVDNSLTDVEFSPAKNPTTPIKNGNSGHQTATSAEKVLVEEKAADEATTSAPADSGEINHDPKVENPATIQDTLIQPQEESSEVEENQQ
ncbi:hypothetical protein L5515_018887 [Caenorhabditis briggsae]|nr:hypothetical protein L5515_018887 [Caenorhabditis briggsae]